MSDRDALRYGLGTLLPVPNNARPAYIVGDGGPPRAEYVWPAPDTVEERIARRVVELLAEERERGAILADYYRLTGSLP